MSRATIGFNVLAHYAENRAALVERIGVIGGDGVLVMDDPSMARQARARLASGGKLTVHRRYQVNDPEIYLRYAPAAWLDLIAGDSADRMLVQCHNEPHIEAHNVAAFVAWNAEALRIAHQRGIRLAVGTFGVGNPHEDLIKGGAFDAMLKALGADDALMVHEYFQDRPTKQGEYGWLCGRVKHWLDRMKVVGCVCKNIIVGEYGRDIGGGNNDGWRGTGWSAEDYAARLIEGMRDIYAPLAAQYGVNISVNVFCAGSGAGGRWQSFNFEGMEAIYNAMQEWNKAQVIQPPVTPPVTPQPPAGYNWGEMALNAVVSVNGSYINMRAEPNTNAKIVSKIVVGEISKVSQNAWTNGGNSWRKIIQADGLPGYFASQYAALRPVVTPSPDETIIDDVPYYSQVTSPGAERDNNDCGETCARMIIGWKLTQANLPDFSMLTIDDLSRDAGKPLHAFLSLGQVQALLQGYTSPQAAYTLGGLTLSKIEAEIDAGRPLIALVRYAFIHPDDRFKGGHFVVVIGYSATHIIIHDPYNGGANYRVTRAAFEQALTQWEGTNPHHSGVLLYAA